MALIVKNGHYLRNNITSRKRNDTDGLT
jgi:hypothetical protein